MLHSYSSLLQIFQMLTFLVFHFFSVTKTEVALFKALSAYFLMALQLVAQDFGGFGTASHISSGAASVLLFITSPSASKQSLDI